MKNMIVLNLIGLILLVIIIGCEASKQMLGWEKVDLIPGAKIVGAGTLNDLALDATATMWF